MASLERLKAAAIDGRAHNIFYRQTQLERLCNALTSQVEDIRKAIRNDYGHNDAEIAVEISFAIDAVKRDYHSLQPLQAHKDEYRIAHGEDAPDSKTPVGIVYIEPSLHTLFYSVIAPLSAAIAAGNCVAVLLENNLRETGGLLRKTLSTALEADTFASVTSRPSDSDLHSDCIVVSQKPGKQEFSPIHLHSNASSRTVAIVDRTADIALAAREIVSARFAFGGQSPYAPDIVLVNEFSKKAFFQAVVRECAELDNDVLTNGSIEKKKDGSALEGALQTLKKQDQDARIVLQDHKTAVLDLPSRLSALPGSKTSVPALAVATIRSLDEAIDLLGRSAEEPYLAAYHFSNLESAKYLSQFVDAELTLVNHISREILIGPAAPSGHPIDLNARFSPYMFSKSRAAYVNSSPVSTKYATALASPHGQPSKELLASASEPLKVMKRSKGGGIGYFEQGFLLNASIILVTIITVSSAGSYYAWRWLRR